MEPGIVPFLSRSRSGHPLACISRLEPIGRKMDLVMTAIRIEDVHVEVPDGRVFVRTWRPEDNPTGAPVVLLHDSLGCVGLWRDFPEALAQRLERTVVAYDRLGFGRSTARSKTIGSHS